MGKVVRITLSLVVSLVLFSVVALAKAGSNNADKDRNKEHHSRVAKLAFWRHHKNADKKAKQAQAKPVQSKQAQANALLMKPSPTKRAAGKKDQEQHASKMSNVPAQKASAATKTKPQEKAQDRTTASLK